MRGYCMVIRIFFQPGANEPVDAQRLTSFPAPFANQGQTSPLTHRDLHHLLHLLSSRGGKPDDMRGYRMVIYTFFYPEAASPMTCRGTVWLSASFVNQEQTSLLTRRGLHRLLHILSSRGGKPDDMRGCRTVIRTFCQSGPTNPLTRED